MRTLLKDAERDEGNRVDESFRSAAFRWAMATKGLVDAANNLKPGSTVVYPALADVRYASNMLESLIMPTAGPEQPVVTADEVQGAVTRLVDHMVETTEAAVEVDTPPAAKPKAKKSADLSAPVWPKNGKMLWAGVQCTACAAMPGQRCLTDSGGYREKPHPQRTVQTEAASSASSTFEAAA